MPLQNLPRNLNAIILWHFLVDWLNVRRKLSVDRPYVEHSAKNIEGRRFDATSKRFLSS